MASILPAHLSDLERDLDAAMARLETIDIPIQTLWNPATCPAFALPYLAWALSVDIWRSEWPEAIKRQVIGAAPEVHRQKGTRPALELALAALDIDVQLTEWWEAAEQTQPGTFDVTVFVNNSLGGDLLGPKNQALILETIEKNKRATAHYTFTLGLAIDGPLQISGTIEPMRSTGDITLSPSYTMELGVTGVFAGGLHNTLTLDLTIG
jgi:phage tail P2-like protein